MAAAAAAAATAEADADAQAVVELVNRFVLSSVQFLNRLADECESRLVRNATSLQKLEVQAELLERLLRFSGDGDAVDQDEDEEEEEAASDAGLLVGDDEEDAGGSDASAAHDGSRPRRRRRPRDAGANGDSDNVSGLPGAAPPSALTFSTSDRRGGRPPPLPRTSRAGPPRPPRPPPSVTRAAAAAAAAQEAEAACRHTLAIVGAPVPMPAFSSDAPPPPPPPLELRPGRLLMRHHPRLRGYFELLALRVPVAFVKAKMQVDGYQAEWLDTPDAPAPAGLSAAVRAFVDEPD